MAAAPGSRPYQLIIYGATGFTGALAAQYLARTKTTKGLRWAIAGRSRSALEAVAAGLSRGPAGAPGIVVAEAKDRASIDAMTAMTEVVMNYAGPFALYATNVVESCVLAGTHHLDITGEHIWVRRMIDKYEADARRTGAVIISMCGMDSIPMDVAVSELHRAVSAQVPDPLTQFTVYGVLVEAKHSSLSGGTLYSAMNMIESEPRSELAKAQDPYFLCPRDAPRGSDKGILTGIRYLPTKGWSGPFVMAGVNELVVRRTNALRKNVYGTTTFTYSESMLTTSWFRALMMAVINVVLLVLIVIPFTRGILKRIGPKPGQGPSKEAQQKGTLKWSAIGEIATAKDRYTAECEFNAFLGEAGYTLTGIMSIEAALALVHQRESVPAQSGGFYTPVAALGDVLTDRLRRADVQIQATVRKS